MLQAIGFDFGFLVWLVGAVLGRRLRSSAPWLLNVQKYVVIAATALLGAGLVVGTFLFLFGGLPPAETVANPVRAALQGSPLWLLAFLFVAVAGRRRAVPTTRGWEVATFNRLADDSLSGATEVAP